MHASTFIYSGTICPRCSCARLQGHGTAMPVGSHVLVGASVLTSPRALSLIHAYGNRNQYVPSPPCTAACAVRCLRAAPPWRSSARSAHWILWPALGLVRSPQNTLVSGMAMHMARRANWHMRDRDGFAPWHAVAGGGARSVERDRALCTATERSRLRAKGATSY